MSESPTLAGLPVQRTKKSRFRLLKRILWLLLLVLVLLVIAGYLLQNLIGKFIFSQLVSEMSAELGTEVRCEKVEFTWKRGFELSGFRISNPAGFGPTAALEVQSAHLDVKVMSLISGLIEIEGRLIAPEIEIRKNREGKSNWEQLTENQRRYQESQVDASAEGEPVRSRSIKVRSSGGDDSDLADFRAQIRDLMAEFSIEKGRVRFVDELAGQRHSIEELHLKLAASEEKQGALFHMGGILTGANNQKSSEFSIVATFPYEGRPTLVFKIPDGIRLQDYHSLVSPFLTEDFESFAGLVRGEIRAAYEERAGVVELEGHLSVVDLDVTGGPLGKGIGARAPLWTLDPSISIDLSGDGKIPQLQGTRVDLGFLKLSVTPKENAAELLSKESQTDAMEALGITVALDLGAMAGQILHPALIGFTGKVKLDVAMDPSIRDERALPLVIVYEATDLAHDSKLTGKDFTLPPQVTGKLVMEIQGGNDPIIGPIVQESTAPGLLIRGSIDKAMQASSQGKVLVRLDPAKAVAWLKPNLPTGLELRGPTEIELDLIGGKLTEDFPRLIEGRVQSASLSWDGNRIDNGHYKLRFNKGRLEIATDMASGKVMTLNKGPIQLSGHIHGLDKEEGDLEFEFKTQWNEGVAAWGLAPYLQYAFPFLAGLDMKDRAKLTQLDYRSFANLELELAGKLPRDMDNLQAAMGSWSGKGRLALKDGSFTPSKAFAGLMKLFGTKDKLRFREFSNGFEIRQGSLEFNQAKIGGGDGHLTLRGKAGLDGKLDIDVDFTDLLSRHRDGKRVLAAAGGKPIMAHMGGTLGSPDFPIENLIGDLFENAIKGGVKSILKDIQKGRKPEDALKDLMKKLRGK